MLVVVCGVGCFHQGGGGAGSENQGGGGGGGGGASQNQALTRRWLGLGGSSQNQRGKFGQNALLWAGRGSTIRPILFVNLFLFNLLNSFCQLFSASVYFIVQVTRQGTLDFYDIFG